MGTPSLQLTGLNAAYVKALQADTLDQAMSVLKEFAARDYVLYNKAIQDTLRKEFTPKWKPRIGLVFVIPLVDQGITSTKTIVLTGTSGVGKTQFAISHFKCPLVVSHIDDLKKLNSNTDGLVFDDMNFAHWPPNACIHLCDMELPRSINVKYGTVEIPANLPRFFTSNKPFNEIWSSVMCHEELAAVKRRCYELEFNEPLFE